VTCCWAKNIIQSRSDKALEPLPEVAAGHVRREGQELIWYRQHPVRMLTHCCNQRFYATVISTYVPNEYPKWVNGVLVRNAEAKLARREALAEALAAARAAEPIRPPSPAGCAARGNGGERTRCQSDSIFRSPRLRPWLWPGL
jgi:hypothetical protein